MFFNCSIDGCDKLFNCKKALKEHERELITKTGPLSGRILPDSFLHIITVICAIRPLLSIPLSKSMQEFMTRRNLTSATIKTAPRHFLK